MKKRPLFGLMVRAFIEKNGKIFLSKEKKERSWETPGGSVRLHETLEQALRREVLEETGYSTRIEKLILTQIGGSKLIKDTKVLGMIYKVKLIKRFIRQHTIKIIAYDTEDNKATVEVKALTILL